MIHGCIWHTSFSGSAAYSLKFYDGAPVRFWRRGREAPLNGTAFQLVNAGEDYAFEAPAPLHSRVTAAFFSPEQVAAAWRNYTEPAGGQLDRPQDAGSLPEFTACHHRASPSLLPFLRRFRIERDASLISPGRVDEILAELLLLSLEPEADLIRVRRQFSPLRPSQREEVLRRITVARSFIEANIDQAPNLDQMAAAACLSKYYFLRRFRAVYGCPPNEFVRRLRLERAAAVILKGQRSLTEIALDNGYGDLAAFSRAFRRHFGVSASQYAQKSNCGQARAPAL